MPGSDTASRAQSHDMARSLRASVQGCAYEECTVRWPQYVMAVVDFVDTAEETKGGESAQSTVRLVASPCVTRVHVEILFSF